MSKDVSGAVSGRISAGFDSHGFGFGDDFSPHGFRVRGPETYRVLFFTRGYPMDIKINH